MDARISEYIDLIKDNSIIIESYNSSESFVDSLKQDNISNEDFIKDTQEISNEELLGYIEYYFGSNDEFTYYDFIDFKFQFNDQTHLKFFKLNNCNLEDFKSKLELKFEEFKKAIAVNFIEIDKSFLKDITKDVKYSKNQLELFITANKENVLHSIEQFMEVKIEFCKETIRFIDYSAFMFPNNSVITNNISEEPNSQVEDKQKTRRRFEISTDLTQNQVVILSHYLRQLGYLGKEMTKKTYAQHIAELTGFAQEKIRQNLSHVDKQSQSTESVLFTEADFSSVRRAMEKLITAIKKDSEEKFS